jgi:hypothetical protein
MRCRLAFAAAVLAAFSFAPAALADDWLPHSKDATWTYEWTESVYNPTPTKEKVTVSESSGTAFTLAWTTVDQGNAPTAPASVGNVEFQETNGGSQNTNWSSNAPPQSFPILCPTGNQCGNSLASTYYNVIWGSRAPVLAAPLLKGTNWTSTGGANSDVVSASDYLGVEKVTIPAFPEPVIAAKIRSEITQVGALGDPYGTGVRTVWWVYGVGPVKVVFEHAGGSSPIFTSVLVSTNQTAKAPPPDTRYFPLVKGAKLKYSWTNTKYMKKPSVQEVTTEAVSAGSARFGVKDVSGPIRVRGGYVMSIHADGVTSLSTQTSSQSLAPFPPLGPRALPKERRRHFSTPFDLMLYGFNPILPAYGTPGAVWGSKIPSRDYSVFGVTGSARILGLQTIKVGKKTYRALAVQSKLTQKGFKFGSGTRTSYFAADTGLVKLVFRHGDGSVSTVQLLG